MYSSTYKYSITKVSISCGICMSCNQIKKIIISNRILASYFIDDANTMDIILL